MLARTIEGLGTPTVTVTMMPDLAMKFRLSRVVGVEFPFGQAFGMVGDKAMQRQVAQAAVHLLAEAEKPETRIDLDIEWPIDTKTAYRSWQPAEPSPIVAMNIARAREAAVARRKQDG